jgi:hypothetical protein
MTTHISTEAQAPFRPVHLATISVVQYECLSATGPQRLPAPSPSVSLLSELSISVELESLNCWTSLDIPLLSSLTTLGDSLSFSRELVKAAVFTDDTNAGRSKRMWLS